MQYQYHIRIKGYLDPSWADWFDGMEIRHEADGDTDLTGVVTDQARLMNILTRISNLNLELTSLTRSPVQKTGNRKETKNVKGDQGG